MKVAAVNWALRPCRRFVDFADHARHLLDQCPEADWVVFPENVCFELLGAAPALAEREVPAWLETTLDAQLECFGRLAHERGIHLLAGTTFVQGRHHALLARPDGTCRPWQPKVNLTRYEEETFGVLHGQGLRPYGRVGCLVCYDSEFPEAGRSLCEAGVEAILVPAFTETQRGFQRVRWSCLARAVENQCFVVHASLVGGLGVEPAPSTYGSSAIIAPSLEPFPPGAVLAETPLDQEAVALAELDFDALAQCRAEGDVRNWRDRRRGDWRIEPN